MGNLGWFFKLNNMKTAMQELLSEMSHPNWDRLSFDARYEIFDKLLDLEKKQIIEARNSKEIEAIEAWDFATDIMSKGVSNKPNNLGRSAEDYYNQTYYQNK